MHKNYLFFLLVASMLLACDSNSLVDSNQSIAGNKWLYSKSAKTEFEITDVNKSYNLSFKLRVNTAYRYANLFVISTLKDSVKTTKLRHQLQIAKPDGSWLGKGSGDLYTYVFPIIRDRRFTKPGKYTIEIEQNMRDNPLVGVSDIGILITKN